MPVRCALPFARFVQPASATGDSGTDGCPREISPALSGCGDAGDAAQAPSGGQPLPRADRAEGARDTLVINYEPTVLGACPGEGLETDEGG